MDDPKLYHEVNDLQTRDIKHFLDDHFHLVKWTPDGGDMVLDVGCGTGNVTCEILLPLLPKNIKHLLAIDINSKMIRLAAKNYQDYKKLSFDVLDIGGNIPVNFRGTFDHVFSFFCLHWIQDQRRVMNNLYSLLKPGGDILLFMVQKCEQIYGSYVRIVTHSKWKKYMPDVSNILLPYQHEDKPEKVLRKNLEEAGFKVGMCKEETKEYAFSDVNAFREFMKSVNPFIKRIPETERDAYMDCLVKEMKDINPAAEDGNGFMKYYNVLMVYGEKPL